MQDDGGFKLHVSDGKAHITIDRTRKRNAISRRMWAQLSDMLHRIRTDPAVRVVILESSDPRIFSAGGDIGEFEEIYSSPESAAQFGKLYGEAVRMLAELPKPTLAVVRGACVGAGCSIATACDLRIADTTAKFTITPARLGIVYGLADTRRLMNLIGISRAKEMLFTSRVLEAGEAHAVGLVDHLHSPDEVESAVLRLSTQISELSQYTIMAAKEIMAEILRGAAGETPVTSRLTTGAYDSVDFLEGVAAFREKRPARFTYTSVG